MASRRRRKSPIGDTNETVAELSKWATFDYNRWQARNTRFQEDQNLWLLARPEGLNAALQKDITILNDPRVLVRKTAALIARHPNVIEVPAAPGVEPDIAQRIENFLYNWDQSVNQKWMMGLHAPYRYDQAFYAVLRGWVCERTMLSPDGEDDMANDPAALWDHQVFDPANVYPHTSGSLIDRVSHVYSIPAGELKLDPFYRDYARETLRMGEPDEVDDKVTIQVRAIYWMDRSGDGGRKPSWWHAVIGGVINPNTGYSHNDEAAYIKEPTEIGYNPWTIVIGKGAAYRNTPWDDAESYLDQIGTGILDEGRTAYEQINRMATKLASMLTLESNPPITVYLQNNQPKQISMQPGSRNWLLQREKLEAHRIGPGVADFKLLWDILQQRVDRAGLPSAFYAEYQGQSGFSAATLMAAGKDILFPFVEAINQLDALKYRKVLELYRDHGPSKKLPVRMQPDGMGKVMSASISASDIKRQGTYVVIDRDDMTPQELANKVNLGIALLREKAISLDTLRRDWIKLKNPGKENLQVLAELVYLNEEVTKQLTPIALQATGLEKLKQIWELVQNPLPPDMPGGQIQTVPGQPPGPQPQPPGLPGETMPPIMGGNLLTNTPATGMPGADMNSILAMLTGAASGGAGAGGLPPIPGTTQPVMPVLPPGRIPF